MPITKQDKEAAISGNRRHEKDSGSPEIQIAILTKDIQELTGHMQKHRKDYASRYGLLLKVNRRNKLLRYLERVSRASYVALTQKLGLRT
ncbi:MAG: 30S ribosomal protein S15 [Planctomycetota bacterium]|jgi:small subunit ribosomal protein S15|nr:30S ribosomal protein S15 [Planctomycetota bacterium]MSR40045.1 30S ribosomal protein S15 [Planctomycetota bacterium]